MTNTILIKQARLIDPVTGIDTVGDILVLDGKIAPPNEAPVDAWVIDGTGLVLTPGFIDLHTHLREPGQEDKESIQSGTEAGARGGFTTLCCMPNTEPAIDNATVVNFIKKQASEAGQIRVLAFGAVTRGRQGKELTDMEELANAGVVGFTDDGAPVATGHLMQSALLYAGQLGLPIMDHCEDYSMVKGLGINEGWVSSRLGLAGYPSAAEESIVARDIALSELTGGHFHVAHLSSAGSVDLVRQAKAKGLHVTAEVTPHHLALSEEWVLGTHGHVEPDAVVTTVAYETRAKVSPPLRSLSDQAALIEALRDGTIDAIATDHAPHTFGDKAAPFDEAPNGISVLDTAFGMLMGLVHTGELELPTLVHRLTAGPVSVLGDRFAELATLAEGTSADLVLLDLDEEWKVDSKNFASKGRNTPLEGDTLRGRVKLTIAGGKIAYDGLSG
jgi:dihydroorotase